MPAMGTPALVVSPLSIDGELAHDAVESGNPVAVGGIATENVAGESDVAVGDRVRFVATRRGAQIIAPFVTTTSAGDAVANGNVLQALVESDGEQDFIALTWPYGFNGLSWDRLRTNQDQTILASAARTATLNSADFTNYNHRGVIVTLDVTASADTPSITLQIEHKDLGGSKYEILLLTTAAVTGAGVHTYIVYPGIGAASDDVVQVAGFPLGRIWRVTVTHADGDSITYSVSAASIL